jgi:hypothetical protein
MVNRPYEGLPRRPPGGDGCDSDSIAVVVDEEIAVAITLIGAGLGRTGTNSLKVALERLTGEPCYHMIEVIGRPDAVAAWERASAGSPADWDAVFAGYSACVDWPACSFWRELAAAYPHAPVLLSTRSSPQAWWDSMAKTIVQAVSQPPKHDLQARHRATLMTIFRSRFCADWPDPDAMMAAYERHNQAVRDEVSAQRLVEWQPGDGWLPLCHALDLPVPDEPFPHVNTTAEFREFAELDAERSAPDR